MNEKKTLTKKIVVTGFMGTGKTVTGKLLASKLKWLHFDTDALAENSEGASVSDIFQKKGEPYFRKLEKRCFEGLISLNEVVITTGGGTLLDSETLKTANNEGTVICLWASEEELKKRLSKDKARPLLKSDFEDVLKLLKEREPMYKKMGHQIDTTGLTPEQVCQKIMAVTGLNG
jgi:shikimate kinase